MIVLYIAAGIIIFFWILLSFNISLRAVFSSGGANNIYAKIGFYKIYILPPKPEKPKKIKKIKKPRKPKKIKTNEKKKKPGKIKEKEVEKPKEQKKLNIPALIKLAKKALLIFWRKIRKYLRIKIYKINLNIASGDAYKTANLYGTAMQSAYYIYELLDGSFKIKRTSPECIKINADFLGEKPSFDIDVKIYIKLSHIFNLAFAEAFAFLKFLTTSSIYKKDVLNNTGKSDNADNTNSSENLDNISPPA